MNDFHNADLNERDRAMLTFAEQLTRNPGDMSREHVLSLRAAGFDDTAIHDIVQVTALFAYYNRIADGLGIEDEPEWQTDGKSEPSPTSTPEHTA